MNDKQIVEYARKLIRANLLQYEETNTATIISEIYNLDNDKTNKELLEHINGVIELLQKAKEIIEKERNENKNDNNRTK